MRLGGVAVLAAWFALAAVASPAIANPVEVVRGTPEVACPDQVAVQQALFAQVGDGAPAHGWRLSYRRTDDTATGGRGRGGGLQLELADDLGKSRLRRQLRVGSGDCRAQAEAIALIVYRFFAQLGGAGGGPLPPPTPVQELASAPSPTAPPLPIPPPASPPPAVLLTAPTARPPALLRLSLEAGAGLWTRRPSAATSIFGFRIAWANVEAAFSVLAPRAPAAEGRGDGAEVKGSALGMAIYLGLVRESARLSLHGGPMSIVCREWGRSRNIAVSTENAGTTAALGVTAGAAWRLWRGLGLGAEAGLGHAVFGNRFVVGGWGQVLAPPPWQGMVLARLGYTFSR
jgi:hypothetical protein